MSEERRRSGPRRRPDSRRRGHDGPPNSNIRGMISGLEEKLRESIKPESLSRLNSFERKLIHRHFDHSAMYETRTYRNGDNFTLYIYPIGNIEKFAREKAQEAVDSGDSVDFPPMGSYERYIVNNTLKDFSGVETASQGEGSERYVQVTSKRFGRGLKRIARKIRLF